MMLWKGNLHESKAYMGTTLADLETESFRESKDDLVAQGPSKPHFQVTKKIIG